MKELALYLGLDPSNYKSSRSLVHCSLIKIVPKPFSDPFIESALNCFEKFTHVVITSKSTIEILLSHLNQRGIAVDHWVKKKTAVVGKTTANHLRRFGIEPNLVALEETAEGLVQELKKIDLNNTYFFWPHSSLARPVIKHFFENAQVNFITCPFYDTEPLIPNPLPNLEDFKEVIFTSPSTVEAFFNLYKELPSHLITTSIGPITSGYLQEKLSRF